MVLLHFNSLFKFVELLFLLHISLLPNVSFFVRGYILLSNRDKDFGTGLYRLSIFEGETIGDYPGSWSTQGLNSFYYLPYSFPNMPKPIGDIWAGCRLKQLNDFSILGVFSKN